MSLKFQDHELLLLNARLQGKNFTRFTIRNKFYFFTFTIFKLIFLKFLYKHFLDWSFNQCKARQQQQREYSYGSFKVLKLILRVSTEKKIKFTILKARFQLFLRFINILKMGKFDLLAPTFKVA